MSRFLAPIHTWLFNKIKVAESLEGELIEAFAERYAEEIQGIINEINSIYGKPLEDLPIEELIDTANIHGWLQGRIAAAETRQAKLIAIVLHNHGEEAKKIARETFEKQARDCGEMAKTMFDCSTAPAIYEALNNYILEGMPCDNVNNVTIKEPNKLQWKNTQCLHKGYWQEAGADVETMYELRYAWIKAFIETANEQFTHEVREENGIIIHDIIDKTR